MNRENISSIITKAIRLFRYLFRRFKEEKGAWRLFKDISLILCIHGIQGLFSEIKSISKQKQRKISIKKAYQVWIHKYDYNVERDRDFLIKIIDNLSKKPSINIILPISDAFEDFIISTISSIQGQIYDNWNLIVLLPHTTECKKIEELKNYIRNQPNLNLLLNYYDNNDDISISLNDAVNSMQGEYLLFMSQGDRIPENTLAELALKVEENPEAVIIYTDDDYINDSNERQNPRFKPNWNQELFFSQNYIGNALIIKREAFKAVGGFSHNYGQAALYEFCLRVTGNSSDKDIIHIPKILYNKIIGKYIDFQYQFEYERSALINYLRDFNIPADVIFYKSGIFRIKYQLPMKNPTVSIIIPTRDKCDILKKCIDSLINRTEYDRMDIIIVDNDSIESETLNYLNNIAMLSNITVLRYRGEFNYSALINYAAQKATGQYLCLLNNDINVIHADWLQEMISHAVQPRSGAVGAKLLYSDERIQHAGIILGIKGAAGHAFKFMKRHQRGYQSRAQSSQQLLAVTAACMVVKKSCFMEVGGFDDKKLKIAFNDVDFCLKLHQAGYKNIYTPYAELFHLESASRGANMTSKRKEQEKAEQDYLTNKWSSYVENDPFYSPNLSKRSDDFSLKE